MVHQYFDEVFMVNLKNHTGKRLKTFAHLGHHGIRPRIWQATNGYSWENLAEFEKYKSRPLGNLHFAEFSEREKKRGSHFIGSPGAWGYIKTYVNILKYSQRKGYRRILIFEDDVILHTQFEQRLKTLLAIIGDTWKVIQLGASQYDWESVNDIDEAAKLGYYLPQMLHTCGSFAICIDMSIADELLEYLSHMDAPFDHIPIGRIYENHRGKCFVAFPNIVIPDVTESSIRHNRDQKSHSEKMKWRLDEFPFPVCKPLVTLVFNNPAQIRNIKIGQSDIEKVFEVNWIYYTDGLFRPVHSSDSPALSVPPKRNDKSNLQRLLTGNKSDYIVALKNDHEYTEQQLANDLEQLILNDSVSDEYELWMPEPTKEGPCKDLVSVVIPTHGRSDTLDAALKSVLQQTYQNVEVIVVDDNETGSPYRKQIDAIIKSYKGDRRVRYIAHGRSMNGAAARNTGIFASEGEYVAFLDDDDVYLPKKIELCLAELKRLDQRYGGVYGGFTGWNSKENNPNRYKSGDLTLDILTLTYSNHYLCTCSSLYRRSALLRINGFDDSFRRHQDLELNLRFFSHYKVGVVRESVVQLRPAPVATTHQLGGDAFFEVKYKYLKKFRHLISSLPKAIQTRIYHANWAEVKKFYKDDEQYYQKLLSLDQDGWAHHTLTVAGLLPNEHIVGTPGSQIKELERTVKEQNKLIEEYREKLRSLEEENQKLHREKESLEGHFNVVPWWWKKTATNETEHSIPREGEIAANGNT